MELYGSERTRDSCMYTREGRTSLLALMVSQAVTYPGSLRIVKAISGSPPLMASTAFATWPSPQSPPSKSRVKNILDKLGANDCTHAVGIGVKRGIIEL
jgi:hypothetical protein